MSKRCPPGVICVENISIIYIIIAICLLGWVFKTFLVESNKSSNPASEKIIIKEVSGNNQLRPQSGVSYSNVPNDVLLNPYTAPLKDDRYRLDTKAGDPRGIPINVRTQGEDAPYRQVGILTRVNGTETILPLMGRPLITNRDKWQFYTMSDKNNNLKLPVSNNGKSCTNEYGCDNLYDGDTIYVEGYNDAFKITMYDNNVMKYIPFI